jgi:septum formation inhibitor-activating ATPase MinD/DNA-binding NarL/FixJ family response regulator
VDSKIKLYIVDFEESTIDRLNELFYDKPQLGIKVVGYCHSYVSFFNDIDQAKTADVLLVSAYLTDTLGVELVPHIKKMIPNAKVIVSLGTNTRTLGEPAREKGADEIIQKPFKAKELIEKIESLVDRSFLSGEDSESNTLLKEPQFDEEVNNYNQAKNTGLFAKTPTPRRSLLDDSFQLSAQHNKLKQKEEDFIEVPNVLAVFYSTGSAGKTTMITNIAMAIAKNSEFKPKICIVDLNLLFPSILYQFHQGDLIMGRKNIYDICDDISSLDEALIEQALVTHEPTGIKILETPSESISNFGRVTPEVIDSLFGRLRHMFDLVLVDTSSNIRDDTTSYPITVSDKTIVLLEPDMANMLHTRKFIRMMEMIENSPNIAQKIIPKLNFVLNKENSSGTGIDAETIRKTLFNHPIRVQIPFDTNVTLFGNNGQFIGDASNSLTVKAILDLARLVYPFEKEFVLDRGKKISQKSSSSILNLVDKIVQRVKK